MVDWTGEIPLEGLVGGTRVIVRGVSLSRQGVVLPTHLGRGHSLLLLASVAEPYPDHLLVQLETVRQHRNFLGGWFRGFVKVLFQRSFDRHLDAGALLALAALRRDLVDVCRGTRCAVSLRQPLLQQRLQLTHVLKAKLQGFEPADGGLAENVAVQSAKGQADVRLGEAQLDPPLLELLGKRLEVI